MGDLSQILVGTAVFIFILGVLVGMMIVIAINKIGDRRGW